MNASRPPPGPWSPRLIAVALAVVCTLPLWFSLPSLRDPYGQSEEAVNAAIWGLGARNLLAEGPVAARLGAKVAPYPGPGPRDGIYAHHPPLPVWVAVVVLLSGDAESGLRLAALLSAGLALWLLFRVLKLFSPEAVALVATAAIATSPYVLVFGRMLTTLTLAAPLLLLALLAALKRGLHDEPWRWTLPLALAALVLSSWDGLLGAGAISLYLALVELRAPRERRAWLRAIAPGLVTAATLALVGAYLLWANGGPEALVWQFRYRSGANLPGAADWLRKQTGFIGEGLGVASLAVLLASPLLRRRAGWPRGLGLALALSAVPGLGMLLIFRQGADRHPFWAFNLILPAACALSGALQVASRRPRAFAALLAALGVQAALGMRLSGEQLGRERILNARGALLRDYFRAHPAPAVRFVSAYNFYPFATWYLRVPTEVAPSLDGLKEKVHSGAWPAGEPVVVDTEQLRAAGCAPFAPAARSTDFRWAIAPAGTVVAACGG